jgi:hypothetical protein
LRSKIQRALAALGLVAATGCAGPSTSLNQVWVDPSYAGGPIQKVFVIGVIKETARKRNFENTMAARFRELGIEAVESWQAIPADKETDETSVRAAVEGKGFDSVIVSQLISVDKRQEYVPGSTYVDSYWGSPAYGYGYYPYYASTYAVVHEPGYTIENTVVSVETNLYDVKSEELKWAAVSETLNPQDVNNAIAEFSHVIVGDLLKQGFVEKK